MWQEVEAEAEAGIASEPMRVPPGLDSLLSDWESQGPFQEAMGA